MNDTEREELVGRAARESVTLSDHDRVRLGLRAQGSQGDAERPGRPVASRRHLLLLAQTVECFRMDVLGRLGLTARETEVLCAAAAIADEADSRASCS